MKNEARAIDATQTSWLAIIDKLTACKQHGGASVSLITLPKSAFPALVLRRLARTRSVIIRHTSELSYSADRLTLNIRLHSSPLNQHDAAQTTHFDTPAATSCIPTLHPGPFRFPQYLPTSPPFIHIPFRLPLLFPALFIIHFRPSPAYGRSGTSMDIPDVHGTPLPLDYA